MSTFAVVITLLLSTGSAWLGATKVSRTFTLERDSAAVREVQTRGVDISGSPLTTLPPADLGLDSTASLFLRVMGTRGVSAPAFPFVLDAASDMLDKPVETPVRPTDR